MRIVSRVPRNTPSVARYHIRIQWRCEYNGQYPVNDWRAYRQFADWPITFPTYETAETFMNKCFTFRGLHGRKLSATIRRCGAKTSSIGYGTHGN